MGLRLNIIIIIIGICCLPYVSLADEPVVIPPQPAPVVTPVIVPEVKQVRVVAKKAVPIKLSAAEYKKKLMVEFDDLPVMVAIARYESTYCTAMFNTQGSSATGCFAITDGTFKDPRFGCKGDRTIFEDNIACARRIYEETGTVRWNASKAKWSAYVDDVTIEMNLLNNQI